MTNALFPWLLEPLARGGGGVTLPSVLDVSVGVSVAAVVAQPSLAAQVQSSLAILIAESIIAPNVQSPVVVALESIQVEVDIC